MFNCDKNGNIIRGSGRIMNGENNLIHSKNKFTAILGLDNIVVVNTDDVTLVVDKRKVEEVKNLVDYLKNNDMKDIT